MRIKQGSRGTGNSSGLFLSVLRSSGFSWGRVKGILDQTSDSDRGCFCHKIRIRKRKTREQMLLLARLCFSLIASLLGLLLVDWVRRVKVEGERDIGIGNNSEA